MPMLLLLLMTSTATTIHHHINMYLSCLFVCLSADGK